MGEPFLLYWICHIKNAVLKYNPPPTWKLLIGLLLRNEFTLQSVWIHYKGNRYHLTGIAVSPKTEQRFRIARNTQNTQPLAESHHRIPGLWFHSWSISLMLPPELRAIIKPPSSFLFIIAWRWSFLKLLSNFLLDLFLVISTRSSNKHTLYHSLKGIYNWSFCYGRY